MAEYKTKLEEFTLEELQHIVSEAPVGWEHYKPEDDCDFPMYLRCNRSERFVFHAEYYEWEDARVPDFRSAYSVVQITNRMLFLKRIGVNMYTTEVTNVEVEISEFVNEVKFVDGKIYLDMDKQDIDGVIKLLEEKIDE